MTTGYSYLLPSGNTSVYNALVDNHGRLITYLRLSLTDRCNLRCRYCMPEKGAKWLPPEEILTYEELGRLVSLFSQLGIRKIRLTGGEPFARKDCLSFIQHLKTSVPGVSQHITTNGILAYTCLDELKSLNIAGINLSLDTLERKRYRYLTGMDGLPQVLQTLRGILDRGIPLKLNSVVLPDTSDRDIQQLAEIARDHKLCLRFIEHMSFDGRVRKEKKSLGASRSLCSRLTSLISGLIEERSTEGSTAKIFSAPGFKGTIGVIEGRSRKFCHSCNKLRITSEGVLKSCLYDKGVLDLKNMLRDGLSDEEIKDAICEIVQHRPLNGKVAERLATMSCSPSMASIGG